MAGQRGSVIDIIGVIANMGGGKGHPGNIAVAFQEFHHLGGWPFGGRCWGFAGWDIPGRASQGYEDQDDDCNQ